LAKTKYKFKCPVCNSSNFVIWESFGSPVTKVWSDSDINNGQVVSFSAPIKHLDISHFCCGNCRWSSSFSLEMMRSKGILEEKLDHE